MSEIGFRGRRLAGRPAGSVCVRPSQEGAHCCCCCCLACLCGPQFITWRRPDVVAAAIDCELKQTASCRREKGNNLLKLMIKLSAARRHFTCAGARSAFGFRLSAFRSSEVPRFELGTWKWSWLGHNWPLRRPSANLNQRERIGSEGKKLKQEPANGLLAVAALRRG